MNKMNKKGFTLIEMLVVIAIIAVLVSIIVPVVSNSTAKAAAATNAANLRSAAATLAVAYLSGEIDPVEDGTEITAFPAGFTKPEAKINGGVEGGTFKAVLEDGAINCYFNTHGVDYYANVATNGKYVASNAQ